jgi:hypothetical protein
LPQHLQLPGFLPQTQYQAHILQIWVRRQHLCRFPLWAGRQRHHQLLIRRQPLLEGLPKRPLQLYRYLPQKFPDGAGLFLLIGLFRYRPQHL